MSIQVRTILEIAGLAVAILTLVVSAIALRRRPASNEVGAGIGSISHSTIGTVNLLQFPPGEQVERIQSRLGEDGSPGFAEVASLARELGITEEMIRAFFRILGEEEIPRERWGQALTEIAITYRQLTQVNSAPSQNPGADMRRASPAKLVSLGRLEEAQSLAERIAEDASSRAQEQGTAQQSNLLELAKAKTTLGQIAALRFAFLTAADHFLAAAELYGVASPAQRIESLGQRANALFSEGALRGNLEALRSAIELLEDMREETTSPLEWTRLTVGVAQGLLMTAEQTGAGEDLDRAIASFREALQKNGEPEVVDLAESGLAYALKLLGERSVSAAPLEESLELFRGIYLRQDPAIDPTAWAWATNAYGTALQSLGERLASEEVLRQAEDLYRSAGKTLSPREDPLEWSRLKANRAGVLRRIARFEPKYESLELAEQEYREALRPISLQSQPVGWIHAMRGLAQVLHDRAKLSPHPGSLKTSIEVYRQLLETWPADAFPLDRAETESDLGRALCDLAEVERNAEYARQALVHFDVALTTFSQAGTPRRYLDAQNSRGSALQCIGSIERDSSSVLEAIALYRMLLTEDLKATDPQVWGRLMHNVGVALATLADIEEQPGRVPQAIDAYRMALSVRTLEASRLEFCETSTLLSQQLIRLAGLRSERQARIADLEEATEVADAAIGDGTWILPPLVQALLASAKGRALGWSGALLGDVGRLEESLNWLAKARGFFEKLGLAEGVSETEKAIHSSKTALDLIQTATRSDH